MFKTNVTHLYNNLKNKKQLIHYLQITTPVALKCGHKSTSWNRRTQMEMNEKKNKNKNNSSALFNATRHSFPSLALKTI